MSYRITKINENQVAILRNLAIKTFVETFAKFNSEENMQLYVNNSLNEEKIREEIANPLSGFYLLQDADNKAIAYLKVNFGEAQSDVYDPESLEIERIYVDAEYQGKKLGQMLFEKALEIAKEQQLKYVWLGVWDQNQKAIGFYKNVGFKEFDSHVFMLGDDKQTDILMRLNIS